MRAPLLVLLIVVVGAGCEASPPVPPPAGGPSEPGASSATRETPVDDKPLHPRPADGSVASAYERGPRCGEDQVLHSFTGQPRARPDQPPECPPSPNDLDPQYGVLPAGLFAFDVPEDELTRLVAERWPGFVFWFALDGVGPEGSPRKQCSYVGCVRLPVASQAPALRRWEERCIAKPGGGTSVPAAGAPDCPAAVKILGAVRPFLRVEERGAYQNGGPPACCYPIARPTPPMP